MWGLYLNEDDNRDNARMRKTYSIMSKSLKVN